MREILFKAKRADDGEWVEGFYLFTNENTHPVIIDMGCCSHIIIPETVGQYTGLTDKNGKKIFEGDIVKTHYANAQKSDFIETVVFHNGKFCGFYENNGCKQWTTLYDGVPHLAIDKSVYMDSVEIVGNIHDNPELLKGGAKE